LRTTRHRAMPGLQRRTRHSRTERVGEHPLVRQLRPNLPENQPATDSTC